MNHHYLNSIDKCPKCDLKVKGRFCKKCGYEVSPNYESKKRSRRLGCFAIVIIILFVVLSVGTYVLSPIICFFGPSGILADSSATTCEVTPFSWIQWIFS